MTAELGVVIPAHNEQSVIARLLTTLVTDAPGDRFEIVVVANGCTDDTAAVAAAVSPRVTVVEIAETSKTAALNAGDEACRTFPRAYVDADVRVSAATLLALAGALDGAGPALVGSPALDVDTTRSSWWVRQHYRIWALSDYRLVGHIGSGIYAVSRSGRARWDRFPPVVADDRFVQQAFAAHERVTLSPPHVFQVDAARTMRAHLRRAARIEAGNRQLTADVDHPHGPPAAGRHLRLLRRVARDPRLWPAFAVYCGGRAISSRRAAALVASGQLVPWNRDEASRQVAGTA